MITTPSTTIIGVGGRRQAAEGLDHPYFEWSALPHRPAHRWPGAKPLALAVIVDLGAPEWEREATQPAVRPPGGRGTRPHPDFPRMSHREYGHRAGVFRLMQVLTEAQIPTAAAVDVLTAEAYPAVMEALAEAKVEIIAHGISASRPITGEMSEAEETDYIQMSLERITRATGQRPQGWMSPGLSQSSRTPALLARASVTYNCDWANDEQPYPLTGSASEMWMLPLSWDVADVNAGFLRGLGPASQARALKEATDVLSTEGTESGRLLTLQLDPWVSGQPYRFRHLAPVLEQLGASESVWRAQPAEIISWCKKGAPHGS